MIRSVHAWQEPLSVARKAALASQPLALLYSGQRTGQGGRYSFLALHPLEEVTGDDWGALARALEGAAASPPRWFGYLGYELLHALEALPRQEAGYITLPDLCFMRFATLLVFDHEAREVHYHGDASGAALLDAPPAPPPCPAPAIAELASSLTRDAYLACVAKTRDAIHRGDFYQANITRKFTGRFGEKVDDFGLYLRLCEASPGLYSAFMRTSHGSVISSSPERFLQIGADGMVSAMPIKGTAPRMADPAQDEAARRALAQSPKDRAENLMIVDLMRNDLARSCEPGSVRVERLFEVSSYATLHHMASTVLGRKRAELTALDVARACFPPGSMTGAPKISAMRWCMEQEGIRRGVYSGALGWLAQEQCDLSVVIRTLVIQADRFEFQVGGGIVADSDPEGEWRETLTKARGLAACLGIEVKQLENL